MRLAVSVCTRLPLANRMPLLWKDVPMAKRLATLGKRVNLEFLTESPDEKERKYNETCCYCDRNFYQL